MAAVPRKRVMTSAIADEIVACADGYSGWFGVATSGLQPACSSVAAFSSSKPGPGPKPSFVTDVGSIAVTGRQNRKWYFAFIMAIIASAPTSFVIASRRLVCGTSRRLLVARLRARPVYWRMTFGVQNSAGVVWSAVRVVLVAAPSDFTSLNAATHGGLDSGGGGAGWNWPGRLSRNGRTFA